MTLRMIKKFVIALIIPLFYGCTTFYGVHPIKSFNSARCEKFIENVKRDNIALSTFISDSGQFRSYQLLFPDSLGRHNSVQPVQILYFYNDSLISYHINCYAKGKLFSLDWNTNGRFDVFPPDSAVPLYEKNVTYKQISEIFDLDIKKGYHIVIFWTNMLAHISKDAVNIVLDNLEKNNICGKCEVLLINTDKFYLQVEWCNRCWQCLTQI